MNFIRLFSFTSCVCAFVASLVLYLYLSSDIASDFKREVFSVELTGSNEIKEVKTLDNAIITSQTIATNLKKNVAKIESINLSDLDNYFESISPLFDSDFFEKFKADKEVERETMLLSDVRTLDFVVTDDPIMVGVHLDGGVATWLFYLEGVYKRDGIFSNNSLNNHFGRKEIWVYIRESVGQNGNPSGTKIVDYR